MPDLVIIFTFVVVAAILTFGFVSSIHKRQIAHKERREALNRESVGASPAAADKKIAKLEERVRVLERLATDPGQNLAAEIEDLRGLPDMELAPGKAENVQ